MRFGLGEITNTDFVQPISQKDRSFWKTQSAAYSGNEYFFIGNESYKPEKR